jgi:hypothetical protein
MSGFLPDTNVPSEVIRARPAASVVAWLRSQDDPSLFLSAVSVGELRRGFTVLPSGYAVHGWNSGLKMIFCLGSMDESLQ